MLKYAINLETVRKYSESNWKLQMTMTDAKALSIELAERLRLTLIQDIEKKKVLVVGITNGGLMTALIVAKCLSVPMDIIGIRRRCSSLKRALGRYKLIVRIVDKAFKVRLIRPLLHPIICGMKKLQVGGSEKTGGVGLEIDKKFIGKHVVLIDDCIASGNTVRMAKRIIFEAGADKVTTGVITIVKLEEEPERIKEFSPIIYLNSKAQHCYPWSQNNIEYDDYLSWLIAKGVKPWT